MADHTENLNITLDYPNQDRAFLNAMSIARSRLQDINNRRLEGSFGPIETVDSAQLALERVTIDLNNGGNKVNYHFTLTIAHPGDEVATQ